MKKLILALLIIILMAAPITAQDNPFEIGCDIDAYTTVVASQLKALTEPGNDHTLSFAIIGVLTQLVNAACNDLSFSSAVDGMSPLLGPVNFPAGFYRATLTTDGHGIVKFTDIDGDCGAGFALFNISAGQGDDGAQKMMATPEGCTAFIEISNTRNPWTLTFENAIPN